MEKFTPMMQQYNKLKAQYPDAILFFRVGDFYEMFGEDAVIGAKVLKLTLTKKHVGKNQTVPLAGVPHHAVHSYLAKLIQSGYKVAICEQTEDPKYAKGVVRREIVRVVSPGTVIESSLLDQKSNNFLVAVNPEVYKYKSEEKNEIKLGVAAVDLSTGEFSITEITDDFNFQKLSAELERLNPKECLLPSEIANETSILYRICKRDSTVIYPVEDYQFEYETAKNILLEQFKTSSLSGFGCEGLYLGVGAAGAILAYLKETQKANLEHINSIRTYSVADYLVLDSVTLQNLEIFTNPRDRTKSGSLLDVIDLTKTAMGARRLRKWLSQPLKHLEPLLRRQQAVEEFYNDHSRRTRLRDLFDNLYDLERLMGKIGCGVANARDLIALNQSLELIPKIIDQLADFSSPLIEELKHQLTDLPEIRELISNAIVPDPPQSLKEGGIIKEGYNSELDKLREIARHGKEWIANLEAKERERTGIKSLKVRYNSVFGYYIEVTKANLSLVPPEYERKQTLANAERFTTKELKEWESQILGAEERIANLEYELFCEIRDKVAQKSKIIQTTADAISQLDVLSTLAEVAVRYQYCRPILITEPIIEIKEGRHPVLEQIGAARGMFVPNDTYVDTQNHRLLLITGPNMAGKSTYIRQVALMVILAQIGSFIPAKEAKIGLVDRIFTRIGSAENLIAGQSTFMVEMQETANILHNATNQSLIILDEVGRGTSTFDGLAIAWAVAEYIHNKIRARTLFATHYHELTELAASLEGVKNYNVAVKEWGDKLVFLHKVVEGPCDRSYGISVGRLAGLPKPVIERAKEVLTELEKNSWRAESAIIPSVQLTFFDFLPEPILEEIKSLDLDKLTPIEALIKLKEYQQQLLNKHRKNKS